MREVVVMFEQILAAVDGSEHGRSVLAATMDLAKLAEATVRVVHVREGSLAARAGLMADSEHDEASMMVDQYVATLEGAGIEATGVVRASLTSLVASEILEEADHSAASVIVMGSSGVSDLKSLLVGSTTHKVLHLGRLPVLVVR